MTKDLNKNILSITYNSLNLPQKVLFRDKQYSKYVYNSDGEKMKAIYFTPFPREVVNPVPDDTVIARPPIHGGRVNAKRRVEIFPSTPSPEMGTHDSIVYCGNFIYSNQRLEQVLFDGGYMTLDSLGLPHYHFYQHDHLGSVRAVVDENGKTEHLDEYYPFGATYVQESAPNNRRYKYNGKELDRMHGLNLLDYGARWYDPLLGRFTTMDPLCEKYYSISPYAYCANNPVNAVDPDGKRVIVQYKNDINKYDYYIFSGFNNTMSSIPNNSFVKDFILAYLYNTKNGGGDCMKSAVYDSNNDYYVIDAMDSNLSDSPSTSFHSQDGKAIITWESRRGLETTDGGRQSAATRLEHEFDHAVDNAKNGTKHRERRNIYNEDYSNEEEKRVILGAEKKTAENNNESIRTNHGGFVFDTRNSISIKPL